MAYTAPTVANFKSRFDRDFAFCGSDQTDFTKVRDVDVERALALAKANFNDGLWADQATFSEARLLLAAHFLCQNLLASTQGLGGSYQWLTNSKAVGPLNESFQIPDRILRSPFLAAISKTLYGALYLEMLSPLLVGNVVVVCGRATP